MDDMREFGRQVRLESNDRGAALLVTANTDLALSQAVYRILKVPENLRQKLEADGGPLSSFSQKIMMGRALGISSKSKKRTPRRFSIPSVFLAC